MANEIKLMDAILNINPNATCSIRENNVDKIIWLDGTSAISKADILSKQTELQTEYDNKKYQRNREIAYPSIQDQLDMQYWDKVNSTTNWQDAIAKVKSDNPKE